jgi:hypothetical protein
VHATDLTNVIRIRRRSISDPKRSLSWKRKVKEYCDALIALLSDGGRLS